MLPILTGLLGVLVGTIVGHWLSLGRDRRIEFNKISEPLYRELEHQRLLAKQGIYPNQGELVTSHGLIEFKQHLENRNRKRFELDFNKYLEARKNSVSQKDFVLNFHPPHLLISAIEQMQLYCVRK